MTQTAFPLTALSETQRMQALERLEIIRPAVEKHVSQAQVARTHHLPPSTVQLWIKRYREKGLAGLANAGRSDKGKPRSLPEQAITLVEGLALQTPPRSAASIHRQVSEIAKEHGWKPPSYERVRLIIKNLDPALVMFAHQGAAAYREEFDLLYRRESPHANAMWQADHSELDVLLLDETGIPAKPWLTAIEDDYSRMIVGYRLSFQKATALTTALALRQAIWHKEDPRWHASGIPTVFYTDHGSDFTSKHLEQVAADLPMELVFSQVSIPRGRGKVERFFRSVDQLLLQDTPGYAPKGATGIKATLTLPVFEQRFRTWLLEDYHYRVHIETKCKPQERWEAGGYVPRMPRSLEHLDLLLLTVAQTRRVQQDGIRFQGYRYIDPTLAGYVKEDVVIRYDFADLAEIRVFHRDRFLCRAICQELAGQTVSLKEIEKARTERRKQVKAGLSTREVLVSFWPPIKKSGLPRSLRGRSRTPKPRGHHSRGILMSEQHGSEPGTFVVTKAYRRFTEVCDACRRFRSIGLGYGPPGTGKTESARYYAQWEQVESFLPESLITFSGRSTVDGFYPYKPLSFSSAQSSTPLLECRTVFYTAPVAASPARIEQQVLALFAAFSYLIEAANERHQGKEEFLVTRRSSHFIELLIIDEANRLKDAGLEQIRDMYDKGKFGLVLLGMPGLDKRLQRAPQLYSRIGFAHQMEALSEEEAHFFLEQRWSQRINAHSDDFTDQEAVAAILRITRGNIRLIERLMMQVELILVANALTIVTKEVVETARKNLIIGFE